MVQTTNKWHLTRYIQEAEIQGIIFAKKDRVNSSFTNNFMNIATLAEVFSWEFREIFKNMFSYRAPLMDASTYQRKSFPLQKGFCQW